MATISSNRAGNPWLPDTALSTVSPIPPHTHVRTHPQVAVRRRPVDLGVAGGEGGLDPVVRLVDLAPVPLCFFVFVFVFV